MKKIGLIRDPTTGNDIMQFLNGTSPLPPANGLFISGSSCGSGKTTIIIEIAKKYSSNGVLIVVPTIEAAEEIGRAIPGAFVLHSNNLDAMEKYGNNPISLMFSEILVITSARLIIDPVELFLGFKGGKRRFVLVDELINFYPEPYSVPHKLKDTLTYIDTTKVHRRGVLVDSFKSDGKTYYQHTYGSLGELRAAYKSSSIKLFSGKSNALSEYKTDAILSHVLSNGFTPIQQKITDFADSHTVILFDGTGDIVFGKDKRMLPISGDRYNSDIQFIQFPMPLKRKNKVGFDAGDLEKYCSGLLEMVADITQHEKLLLVCWKTLDIFKNQGVADSFEDIKVSIDLPKMLKDMMVLNGANPYNLEVIYRGSGQDRGSNEYRDFSSIMFLGEWDLPDNITSDINKMFGCKCKFHDYKLSLLVQTICRTRIRQHQGKSIKVYFSDDLDYNMMWDVQEYFKLNSPETCKIYGLTDPCPRYSRPQKGYLFDLAVLEGHNPNIRKAIGENKTYNFDISLNDLHKLIPTKRKAKDSYKRLIDYLKQFGIIMNIK